MPLFRRGPRCARTDRLFLPALLGLLACVGAPAAPCDADTARRAGLPLPAQAQGFACYTETGADTALLAHLSLIHISEPTRH